MDTIAGLANKNDWERSLERIEAWFQGELLDRPPVRFSRHNEEYEHGDLGSAHGTLRERWFDAEYQVSLFEKRIAGKAFNGETFPVFWPNLGPDVYAALYGWELEYGEVTSWCRHRPVARDGAAGLFLDWTGPYLRFLKEATELALERSKGRWWVGYTDLHPSMDCVAAWLGQSELCTLLYDDPDFADELARRACDDFQDVYDLFHRTLAAAGQPSVNWIGIPVRGRFHIPGCDFSAMLSGAHFERHVLPSVERELATMDHAVFHVDGSGVARHIDALLELSSIQGFQWVQGVGNDLPIMQWVDFIRKIQGRGKGVVVDLTPAELGPFMDAVPPRGIYLCVSAADESEERWVLDRLSKWS